MPDAWQREDNDPIMPIGVIARKVGMSVSAVRKYEQEGLLLPHRAASGHRLFSQEDIDRIRHIHHLIQDVGLSIEAIRRMQALLPCWKLLGCSSATRDACPAYLDATQPCWMTKGLDCARQGNECRECVVYCLGSLCTEEIKSLVYEQWDASDASSRLHALMDRKRRE